MIELSDYGVDVDNDYIISVCDYCAPVVLGHTDESEGGPALNVSGNFAYVGCWDIDDIGDDLGMSCSNCESELSDYGAGYNCHVFIEN